MRSKSAKMEPRWAQDRSKIGPRSSWIVLGGLLFFASFFDRFWLRFGAVLNSKMAPKNDSIVALWGPLGGPRLSWARLGAVLCPIGGSGSLF